MGKGNRSGKVPGWGEPLAQNFDVVYRNVEGASRGLDGPGLVKMPDEEMLVAVLPVKMKDGWYCLIMQSADQGKNWNQVAKLPYFSAVPFEHQGRLYLFAHPAGTEYRNDDLLLLCSDDAGANWSEPVMLFEGHFWNCQTGMAIHNNRLYWAVDDLSVDSTRRGPYAVAGNLSEDLMDPASWRISNLVEFPGLPDSLVNSEITGDYPSARMLEPNVINVNGNLRVLAAVKPPMQATTNLCAVFDIEDDGETIELSFTQFHPMPGGQVKFCVVWDEVSELFWATVNLPADGQDQLGLEDPSEHRGDGPYSGAIGGNDRRFLMLFYGLDGLNWFPAGCVARAGRLSQSFMYPSHIIDGDDLLIIARSSIGGDNRHDADHATFHRISNFRRLAMNLRQDID